MDLHLHDIDWLVSLFGAPSALSARGVTGLSGGVDDVADALRFPSLPGVPVTATASWMRGRRFESGFTAVFERAVLRNDSGKVSLRGPWMDELPMPDIAKSPDMYCRELAYFAGCVRRGVRPERCLPESTALSVQVVEAARRSVARDGAWTRPAAPGRPASGAGSSAKRTRRA